MSQQPIEYASPAPRRRPIGALLLLVLGAFVALAVGLFAVRMLLSGSARVTITVAPPTGPAAAPNPVVLGADPLVIDLQQRRGLQLPGGADTPYLAIGDITGGQTIVTVSQMTGPGLLSRSMKEGDTASFVYGSQTLHVRVRSLRNRLVGDDQATLEVSATRPVSEAEKIDALIAHLESLDGATFVRNGDPHTAKEAAAHLRRKRDYVGDKITTAEMFIDELASKSSQSGEAYTIKLKDGTAVPAGEYLKTKLPEIEAGLRGGK